MGPRFHGTHIAPARVLWISRTGCRRRALTFLLMRAHPSGDAAFFAAIAEMHRGRELLDKVDWGALSSEALIDTVRRMTVVEQQLHVVHDRCRERW